MALACALVLSLVAFRPRGNYTCPSSFPRGAWRGAQGYVLQMQAAKLGVVTRKNLAEHCRERFAPAPRLLLWMMAEVAIIGSDMQGEAWAAPGDAG